MVEDWDDDDDNGGGGGGGHDAGSNPVVWDPLKYDSFSLLHNFFFFFWGFIFNLSFSLCLVSFYFYCWPSATSPDFCDNVFSSLEFSENLKTAFVIVVSEFDKFLAERAAAGGQRTGSVKAGANRPRQRQMQMDTADDEMFGL